MVDNYIKHYKILFENTNFLRPLTNILVEVCYHIEN